MLEPLAVRRKDLIAVFIMAGWRTANKWSDARLLEKLDMLKILDRPENAMHARICNAVAEGRPVEWSGTPKGVKYRDVIPEVISSDKEIEAKILPLKAFITSHNRQPGIYATLLRVLQRASKAAPVTKVQLLEMMIEKFPERDADGMRATIARCVPSYFTKKKGVTIKSNPSGGYWMEMTGDES